MNYKEIIQNVLANGVSKQATRYSPSGDVIPVENGTIGTFCEIFRHDMNEGFPLTTLRKMPWRSIRVELEGFIKGITSKFWYQARGCKFWNEWANPEVVKDHHLIKEFSYDDTMSVEDANKEYNEREKAVKLKTDDLGPIYGFQFRCFGGYSYDLKEVEKKYFNSRYPSWIPKYNIVTELSAEIIDSAGNDDDGRPLIKIKCGSGFEKVLRKDHFSNGFSDPYQITSCGTGYLGETDNIDKTTNLYKNLYKTWSHMLERCYVTNCKEYPYYGGKGIYVCDKWLCFANFYNDCQNLIGFQYKIRSLTEYVLDKDHYSSNVYSPDTCVWLPKEMNIVYSSMIFFKAISPSGEEYYHISPSKFAEIHNLSSKQIRRCIGGVRKSHKKWKFELCHDYGLRFSLPIDQLKSIVDKLKSSPHDRRMVCSAWNPNQMYLMALPSCHVIWGVSVFGNKLNLWWTQRSCDLLLGASANISSYALLLLLLAEESGLEPGELVGTLCDCHIYSNHMDGAREIVERSELPLPKATIKRKDDGSFSIFDWTYNEVELVGYDPHPAIDMGKVTV